MYGSDRWGRMYQQKVWRSSNRIEHAVYWKGKCGAKGETKAKKQKPTPEQIKKQNQINRINTLARTISLNFYPNDYWTCLKYRAGTRKSIEDVKKDFRLFRDRMTREYRKRGEEFKYIYRIELGKRGGIHIHILFNRIWGADILCQGNWPGELCNFEPLRERGDYKQLASYICKPLPEDPAEEQLSMFDDLKDKEYKSVLKLGTSRNLERPKPEVKKYFRRTVRKLLVEGPKAAAGYYIDKESVKIGVNPYTGMSYMYYTELAIIPVTRCIRIPIEPVAEGKRRRNARRGTHDILSMQPGAVPAL